MDDLSQRAARGIALATLAVACVVAGPAPRLLDAFERTYVVALDERRRETPSRGRRIAGLNPRRWRPRGARLGPRRP